MDYTVEKNVPIPAAKRGARKPIYPFSQMAVDESVFIADPDAYRAKGAACGTGNTRKGKQFKSRRVTENEQTGVRIWRVK